MPAMKVLKRLFPFAVIAAAALLLLYSPDIAPPRYTDLATFFRTEMKRQGISGLSVAAVADGSVLYVDGFGKDGSGAAIGPETPVYAAAAAMPLAALAAASLESDKKISLDSTVRYYLPWFGFTRPKGDPTLRDLVAHASGASASTFDDEHPAAPDLDTAGRSMLKAVPQNAPGELFHFIETDYQVLALAMEKAAGMPYAAILKYRVLAPLGMRSTGEGTEPLPRGSASFFSLPLPRAAPRSAFGASSSHIATTASDLGQYMAFLMGPEKFGRGPVSARAAANLLVPLEHGGTYGYGFYISSSKDGRLAYSDGSIDGFSSRIDLWPDERTGIALMSAQDSFLLSDISLPALAQGARRIVLEGSAPRPFPLGRLYILLAVMAIVHVSALAFQTGGALRWTKEVKDRAEAKGSSGPVLLAAARCWIGMAVRAAIVLAFPASLALALDRAMSWKTLLEIEPGLAAWCILACMFGFMRNVTRLAWLRSPGFFRRTRAA
jgi:CubicO group peptidase (beta-lactamase class C family)